MKELKRSELIAIDGGFTKLPSWVRGSVWMIAAGYIMEHWADIKSGAIDGWTDAQRDNK